MNNTFVRVKSIVQHGDRFLILRHWVDDRVVDPYSWEFMDTELEPGESPENAAVRAIKESAGLEGKVVRPLYTWTNMLGDRQCVGIAFLAKFEGEDPEINIGDEYCGHEWIKKEQFDEYIDNKYVVKDILHALELGESK
ncbi:MAG: NUDIX hydrolase [Lachnospiraceae bacterium]|nr:NUDIX hydrolase [Lachnospiraceae bacterium]